MRIPALLSAEDMINPACDELSMMTYVAQYRLYYEKNQDEIDRRLGIGKGTLSSEEIVKAAEAVCNNTASRDCANV